LNPNFFPPHKNRYSEGMDGGQRTPRGHPDFNSYVKILRVLVFRTDGRTDGQTERQTEKLIRCGLPSLRSSRLMKYLLLCLNGSVLAIDCFAHTMVLTYLILCTHIQSTVIQLTTPSLLICVMNQLTQTTVLLSCQFTTGHFQYHPCTASSISGPLVSYKLCGISKEFANLV
jgi:hypothetical protein